MEYPALSPQSRNYLSLFAGGPGRTRTCNQTVMSGGTWIRLPEIRVASSRRRVIIALYLSMHARGTKVRELPQETLRDKYCS